MGLAALVGSMAGVRAVVISQLVVAGGVVGPPTCGKAAMHSATA